MNYHNFELFEQFVKNDFKLRYKNSFLGLLWVILKPMAMFAISYVVWSNIFGVDPLFKQYLLLGLIIMMFFSELMMMGLSSLMSRAYIILKVNFKREIAIYSATFIAVIDLLVNLFIFFIFSLNSSAVTSPIGIGLFILSMFTLYILCMGVTLFLAIWFIKLRDLQNIVELGIQLLYWGTPIFYPLSIIPERYRSFIQYNPLTIVVSAAREGLIYGNKVTNGSFTQILILLLISVTIFILGRIFFKKNVTKIAEFF